MVGARIVQFLHSPDRGIPKQPLFLPCCYSITLLISESNPFSRITPSGGISSAAEKSLSILELQHGRRHEPCSPATLKRGDAAAACMVQARFWGNSPEWADFERSREISQYSGAQTRSAHESSLSPTLRAEGFQSNLQCINLGGRRTAPGGRISSEVEKSLSILTH